jgi:hypothetical protein
MNARPITLREIAERSDSLEEFGRHFQDWLHTVRSFRARPQVEAAIREAPPRLARRFAKGRIADAWLAAYAEFTAGKIGRLVPAWTAGRISPEPWYAVAGRNTRARAAARRDSPAPFKARNLYTPGVNLPLHLSAGRPAKTTQELRRANAERQRRFRARRKFEWLRLRAGG